MKESARNQKEQDSTNFFIGITIMIVGLIALAAIISLVVKFVTKPASSDAASPEAPAAQEEPIAEDSSAGAEKEASESWFSKITSIFSKDDKKEGGTAGGHEVEKSGGASYIVDGSVTVTLSGCSKRFAPDDDTSQDITIKYRVKNDSDADVNFSSGGWFFTLQDGSTYIPSSSDILTAAAGSENDFEVVFRMPADAALESVSAVYSYGEYTPEMADAVLQTNSSTMPKDDLTTAYGELPQLEFKFAAK